MKNYVGYIKEFGIFPKCNSNFIISFNNGVVLVVTLERLTLGQIVEVGRIK